MIYILDAINGELVQSEIVPLDAKSVPLKKEGWSFNWRRILADRENRIYGLRRMDSARQIEGALCLRVELNMLIMDALELAPHNIGRKTKRYDHVAGCLIAFACRESFRLEGDYKGFLTFVSKTNLIKWYATKYGATLALGQRMYIDWDAGERLIKEYLERIKTG